MHFTVSRHASPLYYVNLKHIKTHKKNISDQNIEVNETESYAL